MPMIRGRAAAGRVGRWLTRLKDHLVKPRATPSDRQRALDLIKAIDAGGIPLSPARVNQVARSLGLEVSRHAPVEATIERIRSALSRMASS